MRMMRRNRGHPVRASSRAAAEADAAPARIRRLERRARIELEYCFSSPTAPIHWIQFFDSSLRRDFDRFRFGLVRKRSDVFAAL